MFTIENKLDSVIKITVVESLNLDDLKKILGVLTRVFQAKKHFAFYVHCNFTETPSNVTQVTKYLLTWMKESHDDIVNYLEGSSLIIKSNVIAALFNSVFKIHGPVKPNYITTDYKSGEEFVFNLMKKYKAVSLQKD